MMTSCRPPFVAALSAALLLMPLSVAAQTVEENDSSASEARRENSLPLIPTRTLDFTTSEGTWISVDLSPDQSTILFELLGDLYTIPASGGDATRITTGQAYDMQPRYSPDGRRIVFVSDRDGSENLWIANTDGSDAHQLTDGERENYMSPVWTPDGSYVMATKGTQQWLYHVDGGSGVQVTGHRAEGAPAPASHFGAAFGSDDRYVWLNLSGNLGGGLTADGFVGGTSGLGLDPAAMWGGESVPADEALAWNPDDHDRLMPEPGDPGFGPEHGPRSSARQLGSYQIGMLDRETGRVFVRTHEHEGAFRPMPSPDGRWLVYATRYDASTALKLRDLETGEEQWLVMDVQRDDSQGGRTRDRDVYPGGAWTADSRSLITSYGGKIMRVSVPSGEAREIPFTAHVQQQLGPLALFDYPIDDESLRVAQIRGARPSPDGERIVFAALDRLWVADLTEPSGTQTDGFPVLRDAERLTESTEVEHAPVWSPDGRWISYVTWNDSVGGDIWRVRPGGGEPERLTTRSAFYDKIAYTADGARLMAIRGSMMHRMRTLEDFGRHSPTAELEYVWLPADGGDTERITWVGSGQTQQGRNAPHVGPDPDRMYVWAGREGLLSMRMDGTDIRVEVKVTAPARPGPGSAPTPDEVVLSPNGSRAIVRANRNVYLITVPPVGGEAPTVSVSSSSVVPTRRLTKVGGDFVGWSHDSSVAHYSIGRSYFEYDIETADALIADSVVTARAEAAAELEDEDETEGTEPQEQPGEEGEGGPVYEATRFEVEIVAQKDKPEGVIALTGARLITMDGDEVIERGDLVIRDNRIAAVGPSGSVDIPVDAEVQDMSGRTIYPGLVDIHAHTWFAWGVHRSQVSQLLAQLAYGVTTQRDPQTSSEDIVTYADLMETGDLIGPRLFSTGPGIFGADQISSLDEARDVLRRYADHYNTQTIKQYLAGDRKIRQWVIMASRELGLTPTTEGGSNFTMNLTLAQDGYAGLEHSLPISPFYEDVVRLGAVSGMVYTPTFIVAYGGPSGRQYYLTNTDMDGIDRLQRFTPHDEMDKWKSTQWYRTDQYPHVLHAEQLVKWMDEGGQAGLGSHGEVQGLGTHWELWMMASGGMDNHTALEMATIMSANAIGLGGDLGSLEVGKLADLQVLTSNPLDDLENTVDIEYVMKNGRMYEADTLDEVWPRQRELPTQWWWRVEPPNADADRTGNR